MRMIRLNSCLFWDSELELNKGEIRHTESGSSEKLLTASFCFLSFNQNREMCDLNRTSCTFLITKRFERVTFLINLLLLNI